MLFSNNIRTADILNGKLVDYIFNFNMLSRKRRHAQREIRLEVAPFCTRQLKGLLEII